jgi:hypothetical protein
MSFLFVAFASFTPETSNSGTTIWRATRAASLLAAFLEGPYPFPYSTPPISTVALYIMKKMRKNLKIWIHETEPSLNKLK